MTRNNEKQNRDSHKTLPNADTKVMGIRDKIPTDLVEDLERVFSENTKPSDSHGEVMYAAGQRSVVRYLRRVLHEQIRTERDHVLPRRRRSG